METKKRKILCFLIPPLLSIVIRLLYWTCRREWQIHPKMEQWDKTKPFILAFWHGELLMQPFLLRQYDSSKEAFVLISNHFDGELISATMRYFNIFSIRGSSSKGGVKAMLSAIKKLKENKLVVITPDGPRGPYHHIADGVVVLAQKSQKPIVISRILYQKCWRLKSWDRFQIPKPFSKIIHIIKEPLYLDDMDFDEAKSKISAKMEEDCLENE